jgi:protein-disulfide isomerase
MENDDQNVNRWVDERMSHLEAPEWRPDAGRGLARLRQKGRTVRRRRWGISLAGAAALAASLFTIPGCQAATCKVQSQNLAEHLWNAVFRVKDVAPPRVIPAVPAAPAPPKTSANAFSPAPVPPLPQIAAPANFKETGSPSAPVMCEIYTDYECPHCATFYAEIVPQLRADYVNTGKVKLLHRDFPLPMHRHSRLAARYANAAGLAGQYDAAVAQIFRTQQAWGLTGDVDTQLAQVLTPDLMARVRHTVETDTHLDDSVLADVEQGRADQLRQTPTVVIVSKGQRQVLAYTDYEELKTILDEAIRRP